jgi:phytoene synthase
MPSSETKSDTTRSEDLLVCKSLLKNGSKSFFVSSLLLPARLRAPVLALYAFCRVADDVVDSNSSPIELVEAMRRRLLEIYEGQAHSDPVTRAFASTVTRFSIPHALPDALFEGFEWDAKGRRYNTLADVRDYAMRVAGTVGLMMAMIMGQRDPSALARACDLGVAMQLTNIARDIGEDARAGRLYLPTDWFKEQGVDPENWLIAPRFEPMIALFADRLLKEADRLYRRSESGIGLLPLSCRPAIWAARYIYDEIGTRIRSNGCDSVSTRAVVTAPRKLGLLGLALISTATRRSGYVAQDLPEARFAIEAVSRLTPPHGEPEGFRGITRKISWTIELFERLERRDRRIYARQEKDAQAI